MSSKYTDSKEKDTESKIILPQMYVKVPVKRYTKEQLHRIAAEIIRKR